MYKSLRLSATGLVNGDCDRPCRDKDLFQTRPEADQLTGRWPILRHKPNLPALITFYSGDAFGRQRANIAAV